MIADLENFFKIEMIYLWLNFGVLPLWIALIIFPNSKISQIFITSIFIPFIFAGMYAYVAYNFIFQKNNFIEVFDLYLGIENLYSLFLNENFLLIFWIHFLALNLFLGCWTATDSIKYNISKILTGICLIFIYFTGPLGFIVYWFIRIFYSKKIKLYD